MKIKYSLSILTLSFELVYGADTTTKMPVGNYYEGSHLAYLNERGIKKHAPLSIIIDEEGQENPKKSNVALTLDLANILQTAFIPTIVSHSIVYNYFTRRSRNMDDFSPQENPVSFNEWHLYDIPHSAFFLFVPRHYMHYYNGFGFNLRYLINISTTLPTKGDYKPIIHYIESHMQQLPFSVYDLKTALTSIKRSFRSDNQAQLTKQELKYRDPQQPIWDIILNGHGNKDHIAGLEQYQIHNVLDFFNNELTVGTIYIQSCSAGGENLNLLEFDMTVNKEHILRNLNYILIVGSITDKPTMHRSITELYYQFYNNAARLQEPGKALDRLLEGLYTLTPTFGSMHGSSEIPQVWLPGGLGFQTYQINDKVQILGNVKVRAHEDEHRPIKLPNSTIVLLIYAPTINVPLSIGPHTTSPAELAYSTISSLRKYFMREHLLTIAQFLQATTYDGADLRKKIGSYSHNYPALMRILTTFQDQYNQYIDKSMNLIYPEFISMLRGNLTTQYINTLEVQPPVGKERELTGVMHFIRDAFFDIGGRNTIKTFLIDELTGNNDISALLELYRLNNKISSQLPSSTPLELKLRNSIGKNITLEKVRVTTVKDQGSLQFIYDNTAWNINFELQQDPKIQPDFSRFWDRVTQTDAAEYQRLFIASKNAIMPEPIQQKSMREVLLQKAVTYQAFKSTGRASTVASAQFPAAAEHLAKSTPEQREIMITDFEKIRHDMVANTIKNINKTFPTETIDSDIKRIIEQCINQAKNAKQAIDIDKNESLLVLKTSIDRYAHAKETLDLLVIFGSTRQEILNIITRINTKFKGLTMSPNVTKAINININRAKEIKLYVTKLPEVIYADDIQNLYRIITEYMQTRDNLMNIVRL